MSTQKRNSIPLLVGAGEDNVFVGSFYLFIYWCWGCAAMTDEFTEDFHKTFTFRKYVTDAEAVLFISLLNKKNLLSYILK